MPWGITLPWVQPSSPQLESNGCSCSQSCLLQLRQVFGGVRVELLDAGLAAKLDLLAVVNLGDGRAHAAEFITTDDTGLERISGGSSRDEAGTEEEAGEEGEGQFHGGFGLS